MLRRFNRSMKIDLQSHKMKLYRSVIGGDTRI